MFYKLTRPGLNFINELTIVIHRDEHWQIINFADFHVVHTKSRRDMHQSGTIRRGDILRVDDIVRVLFKGINLKSGS